MRLISIRLGCACALLASLCLGLSAQALENLISSHLRRNSVLRSGVHWGIAAQGIDSGRYFAEIRADEPLKPASSLKSLVAAAALDLLGPDYRIPTTVFADGSRDGSTLQGDLWILGLADPTYNGIHSDSASAALRNLADAIRDTGIRRVSGDLVITGLLVYADGRGATRVLGDGADTLCLSNERSDRGRLTPTDIGYARIVGQDDFIREANRAAGERLRSHLSEIGVRISGSIRLSTRIAPPGIQIARRLSPPLQSVVRRVLHSSINLHSDLLLLHLGYTQRHEIRLSAGISTVTEWLARTGTSTQGLHLVDGSGLSHRNRMTARQLLAVQRAMCESEHADVWAEVLPTAGRSGTLAHRMRNTGAAGNLHAKTGTLTGAASLAGFVVDEAHGERVAFAIIENSLYERPIDRSRARRIIDGVALLITEGAIDFDLPLRDSFTANDTGGWTTQRGTQMYSGVERETPEGDGRVARLVSRGPGQAMAVTGPIDTRSVAVQARVHLSYDTQGDETSRVPYQGIVVRAEGDNWIRMIGDFDRDRTIKVHAHIDGQWIRLRTWTFPQDFPDPGGAGWHTFRLELRGDEITAFYDGNRLPGEPIRFTRRPSGRCGLYAWHWGGRSGDRNIAHFDDFLIEPLD